MSDHNYPVIAATLLSTVHCASRRWQQYRLRAIREGQQYHLTVSLGKNPPHIEADFETRTQFEQYLLDEHLPVSGWHAEEPTPVEN